jgi:hypothetical protein
LPAGSQTGRVNCRDRGWEDRGFRATTAANGSFEFSRLPEATYRLRVQLPKDLFIWWASDKLKREYAVAPGKMLAQVKFISKLFGIAA